MHQEYSYKDKLQSNRLRTRFLTVGDIEPWSHFFEDLEGTRFLLNPDKLGHHQRAALWIEKQLKRYENREFGLQALVDIETGAFIGQCGLLEQEVDGNIEIEIGYHLFKQHRHKGYATEAASMFKHYGFDELELPTIVSIIHIDNVDSQAVAGRNGMHLSGQSKKWDIDVLIYRVNRDVWMKTETFIK